MTRLGFSVDLPSALRFFCQSFFIASTASYHMSEVVVLPYLFVDSP